MGRKKAVAVHRCQCRHCRDLTELNITSRKIGEWHTAINRVFAIADERQKRLIAGLLGQILHIHAYPLHFNRRYRNGNSAVADITGISRDTIRRGWEELTRPNFLLTGRTRRPGAGRKPSPARTKRGET